MIYDFRQQHTLCAPTEIAGFGYWSGHDVRVRFEPAPANTGITFVRDDLPGQPAVAAEVGQRSDAPLRTNLVGETAGVQMVEHIMAALAGLRIDNCRVCVDAEEMPGCDGSSEPFCALLLAAGRQPQDAVRAQLWVRETVMVQEGEAWLKAEPVSHPQLRIDCRLDFGDRTPIGKQQTRLVVNPRSFRTELAAARTFIMQREAEALRQQGLGRRVTCRDLLVLDEQGPIENSLRFQDEYVRHKALDLVGDLALSGCDIVGSITSHRGGHRLNAALVARLLETGQITRGLRRSA